MGLRTGKKHAGQHHSTASVVEGTLILTLPNARTPTVWRMGLETASTAAFQAVSSSDGDGHTLVMVAADGKQHNIASFDDREQTVEALMAASEAMQNLGNRSATTQPAARVSTQHDSAPAVQAQNHSPGKRRGPGRALMTATGIILIVVLLYMIANTGPQRFTPDGRVADTGGNSADAGGGQRPMSAEKFLQQRQ